MAVLFHGIWVEGQAVTLKFSFWVLKFQNYSRWVYVILLRHGVDIFHPRLLSCIHKEMIWWHLYSPLMGLPNTHWYSNALTHSYTQTNPTFRCAQKRGSNCISQKLAYHNMEAQQEVKLITRDFLSSQQYHLCHILFQPPSFAKLIQPPDWWQLNKMLIKKTNLTGVLWSGHHRRPLENVHLCQTAQCQRGCNFRAGCRNVL